MHALTRLRSLLRLGQGAVHRLTTESDHVHPSVAEMVSILLSQVGPQAGRLRP